ncbi:hypothetical protein DV736_g3924, partial [Chaetothyriales sp. CBS 134916]
MANTYLKITSADGTELLSSAVLDAARFRSIDGLHHDHEQEEVRKGWNSPRDDESRLRRGESDPDGATVGWQFRFKEVLTIRSNLKAAAAHGANIWNRSAQEQAETTDLEDKSRYRQESWMVLSSD